MLKSVKWILPVSLWILSAVPVWGVDGGVTNTGSPLSLTEFRWASGLYRQFIIDFMPAAGGYSYAQEAYPGMLGDTGRNHSGEFGFLLEPRVAVEVISDKSETSYGGSVSISPSFSYSSFSNHRLNPRETREWSSSSERAPLNPSFSARLSGFRAQTFYPGVFHLGYSLSGTVGVTVEALHESRQSDSVIVDNFNSDILRYSDTVVRRDRVSREYTAWIDPEFVCGFGRIYDATPLFAAMRIIEDLRNRGLLAAEPSRDEMRMLAVLCRTNIMDKWDDRENHIERISRISEFLCERGCLKEMNPESVLRIRDSLVWLPYRISRKHGSMLRLVLFPGVSARVRTESSKYGPNTDTVTIRSNGILLTSYVLASSNWSRDYFSGFMFNPSARLAYEVLKPVSRRLQFDQAYSVFARLGEGSIVRQTMSNSYGTRLAVSAREWQGFVALEPRILISLAYVPSDRWILRATSDASGHLGMVPKAGGAWFFNSSGFGESLSFDIACSLRQELVYSFGASVHVGFRPNDTGFVLNSGWNLSGKLSYRIF